MKVLCIDENIEMRDYVSTILEARLDCEVVEAGSGDEALAILNSELAEIDFVITEVKMEKGDQDLIANWLGENQWPVPIIWLSEPAHRKMDIVEQALAMDSDNAFVSKPFKTEQLLSAVDKILLSDKIKDKVSNELVSLKESCLGEGESEIKEILESPSSLSLETKKNSEEADWSLKKETGEAGEEEADWSLKKETGEAGEEEADWSLKKETGEAGEEEADWSLTKEASDEGYDREKYRRIKAKRFLNFQEAHCDIFIKLGDSKYVKLINKKENYNSVFVERYINKGAHYFYILKEDYQHFNDIFGSLVFEKLKVAEELPFEVQVVAELAAYEHTLKYAREFGITEETALKVRKAVDFSLKNLEEIPNFEQQLENILRGRSYLSEHSLFLSYVASQICLKTSWGNQQALEKLTMAAILHDVALEDDALARIRSIKEPTFLKLNKKEQEKVKDHPGGAVKIISEGKSIFPDVETIVLQHHERPDQSGFPKGIGALSISPLACIFIVAEDLVNRVYSQDPSMVDWDEIKKDFNAIYNKGNFGKILDAFLNAF